MEDRSRALAHLSYMSILLCSNFTRADWLWLVAHKDPYVRSYAYMNKACPAEILQIALLEKSESEAGVLSSAALHENAPAEIIEMAFTSPHWPARFAAFSRGALDWNRLRQERTPLSMSEKVVLFGRADCPEWLLRDMWTLPVQLSLDGKDDINKTLRTIAVRRLKKQNLLTPDELSALKKEEEENEK